MAFKKQLYHYFDGKEKSKILALLHRIKTIEAISNLKLSHRKKNSDYVGTDSLHRILYDRSLTISLMPNLARDPRICTQINISALKYLEPIGNQLCPGKYHMLCHFHLLWRNLAPWKEEGCNPTYWELKNIMASYKCFSKQLPWSVSEYYVELKLLLFHLATINSFF